MSQNGLFHAQILVNRDGKVTRHPEGRFVISNGILRHLESYHGLLKDRIPEGPVDDLTINAINNPGSDLAIASHDDIGKGHRLDFVPENPLSRPLAQVQPENAPTTSIADEALVVKPKPVWLYQRTGHDSSHTLEHHGQGKYSLDGNPLKDDEVQTILRNLSVKAATLRYKGDGMVDTIAKFEQSFSALSKSDEMDPQAALAHLDSLHQVGDEHTKAAISALRRHMFQDPMTPTGNKYAWEEFKKKNTPGTYVSMDANNFKGINDSFGHDAGDNAIKAFGTAIKAASDPVGQGKVFRAGGDEFVAHFPTLNHAHVFARNLQQHLDQVPPVGGTHKLSMSLGIGHNYLAADQALSHAKEGKAGTNVSTVPTVLAHSLHPDAPGRVPVDPPMVPKIPQAAAVEPQHSV